MHDHVSGNGLQRAELARRTGCNLETVRYYEKIGLMPDPPRTAAGYRIYDEAHVARLGFILRARELGFALEEVRALLRLVEAGGYSCAEVRSMTVRHLADVQARIKDLRRLESVLKETVAACSGDDVPDCPVIDALAGRKGSG